MLPSVIGGAPRELQWSAAGATKAGHRSCNGPSPVLERPATGATNAGSDRCKRATLMLPAGATVLSARAAMRPAIVDVLPAPAAPPELQ